MKFDVATRFERISASYSEDGVTPEAAVKDTRGNSLHVNVALFVVASILISGAVLSVPRISGAVWQSVAAAPPPFNSSICVVMAGSYLIPDSPTKIWPLPQSYSQGGGSLSVSNGLKFVGVGAGGSAATLLAAFARYQSLLFPRKALSRLFMKEKLQPEALQQVFVWVLDANEELNLGVDESYCLVVPSDGSPAHIQATTVYGAMRALETFSQLCAFNFTSKAVEIAGAPWVISDAPRFPHRGLLMATGTWWTSKPFLSRCSRTPSYGRAPTRPASATLSKMPGTSSNFAAIFPYKMVHLGGDEVSTACWNASSHITKWMVEHDLTPTTAYAYFVLRVQRIAEELGWTPVNWEEPFDNFPEGISNRTVVHEWMGKGPASAAVALGFHALVSNQDRWYLDWLNVGWQDFYNNEPWQGIEDAAQRQLVLGGEVCMWGETADPSDLLATIWPRAAAAAGAGSLPHPSVARAGELLKNRAVAIFSSQQYEHKRAAFHRGYLVSWPRLLASSIWLLKGLYRRGG
eukprot:jgi/Mesen1/9159/ME000059S08572